VTNRVTVNRVIVNGTIPVARIVSSKSKKRVRRKSTLNGRGGGLS
jgi:hypothetical protein